MRSTIPMASYRGRLYPVFSGPEVCTSHSKPSCPQGGGYLHDLRENNSRDRRGEGGVMPEVLNNLWKHPPAGENQWRVTLGGLILLVNSRSHQEAKRLAVNHWAQCNKAPDKFLLSLKARISEGWRGGLSAKRLHKNSADGAAKEG